MFLFLFFHHHLYFFSYFFKIKEQSQRSEKNNRFCFELLFEPFSVVHFLVYFVLFFSCPFLYTLSFSFVITFTVYNCCDPPLIFIFFIYNIWTVWSTFNLFFFLLFQDKKLYAFSFFTKIKTFRQKIWMFFFFGFKVWRSRWIFGKCVEKRLT